MLIHNITILILYNLITKLKKNYNILATKIQECVFKGEHVYKT